MGSRFGAVAGAARRTVEGGVPACQVAVAVDGEVELFEAFGDCTTASRFAIYSATKPMVAAAVWQLLGEGLLDVSLPVAHYIPEFGENGKEAVTVEQVLLHTSGFPDAPMGPEEGADPERRIARFRTWRLQWEPGTRFVYHPGSAHWVLAELIHRLRGADFRDVVEERVTTPLGLPRLLGVREGEQDGIVEGVVGDGGDAEILTKLSTPSARAAGIPGGGGIATAADVARFYQGLLHDPKGQWDPAVLADAKTNVRCNLPDPIMNTPVMRTLGLVLAGDDGKHVFRYGSFGSGNSPGTFGHAGAYFQFAWADPATGMSFCYLHNLVADQRASAMLTMPVTIVASSSP